MEKRLLIGIGAMGLVAGMVYMKQKSSSTQSSNANALGTQANNNLLSTMFNSITRPVAEPVKALDATPTAKPVAEVSAAPVEIQNASQWVQTKNTPDNIKRDNLGFEITGPSAWDTKSAMITTFLASNGVADNAAVSNLATWAREHDVNLKELSAAAGYERQDVKAVFTNAGIDF
jgi:hypothetical protein